MLQAQSSIAIRLSALATLPALGSFATLAAMVSTPPSGPPTPAPPAPALASTGMLWLRLWLWLRLRWRNQPNGGPHLPSKGSSGCLHRRPAAAAAAAARGPAARGRGWRRQGLRVGLHVRPPHLTVDVHLVQYCQIVHVALYVSFVVLHTQ